MRGYIGCLLAIRTEYQAALCDIAVLLTLFAIGYYELAVSLFGTVGQMLAVGAEHQAHLYGLVLLAFCAIFYHKRFGTEHSAECIVLAVRAESERILKDAVVFGAFSPVQVDNEMKAHSRYITCAPLVGAYDE